MSYIAGQQQLKDRINVHTKGRGGRRRVTVVEISTVDFPNLPGGRTMPPETCLFWPDPGTIMGQGSEVVEKYADWAEAREGHRRWVDSPAEVVKVMVEAGWRR